MKKMPASLTVLVVILAILVGGACDDDPADAPDGSSSDLSSDLGGTDGKSGDGKTGDGKAATDGARDAKAGDGAKITDAPQDGQGWIPSEGGPIIVDDGGVVITEDGGFKMVCYVTKCAGKTLQCGDCIDNDGDGKIDWRDPECLGPCDNTEGPGLESGVGGTTGASCGVDCYFDYGNGAGNDDCHWDHSCDLLQPELPKCPYDAKLVGGKKCPAVQSPKCKSFCLPYTPNGCDCFGCCTFPALKGKGAGGKDGYVWIGAMDASNNSTCTLKDVTDNKKCPPCTPVGNCLNTCGKCEVCVGKPLPPPECYKKPDAGVKDAKVGDGSGTTTDGTKPPKDAFTSDSGGGSSQCPGGEQPCGLPGQNPCIKGYYCISGCCIKVMIN